MADIYYGPVKMDDLTDAQWDSIRPYSTSSVITFNEIPKMFFKYAYRSYVGLTIKLTQPSANVYQYDLIDATNTVIYTNSDLKTFFTTISQTLPNAKFYYFCKITFSNTTDLVHYKAQSVILEKSDRVIMCYTLRSSNDTVTKHITLIGGCVGDWEIPISLRDIELTVVNNNSVPSDIGFLFNYVYILSLNRYYYVTDIVKTKSTNTFKLHEDVLMSFDSLIRLQTAFVNRNENTYHVNVIDNRQILRNEPDISYVEINNDIFDVVLDGSTVFPPIEDRSIRFVVTVVGDNT